MSQRTSEWRLARVILLPALLLLLACSKDSGDGLERGTASWYGHPYHGRKTASGETYDMVQLTSAHRLLPFGSMVRVTNLANQKSVVVRINDRGPFVKGRIIDLSHAAAQQLGIQGLGEVSLEVLSSPKTRAASNFAVQVGFLLSQEEAERVREMMVQKFGTARVVEKDGDPKAWRVIVGSEATLQLAELLGEKIAADAASGDYFVVALDD